VIATALYIALTIAGARPEDATVLTADIDGDGHGDTITFHADAARGRGFVHVTSTHGALAARPSTSPLYPAWKADAGRIDGSGRDAVVLGVWTTKHTRAGEPPRRTIWVAALDGARWVERWRGSKLARPFDDFAVRDLDGDGTAELVVRECDAGAPQGYTAYRWQGFGFAGVARLRDPCDAEAVPAWHRLRMSGGRLWLDD